MYIEHPIEHYAYMYFVTYKNVRVHKNINKTFLVYFTASVRIPIFFPPPVRVVVRPHRSRFGIIRVCRYLLLRTGKPLRTLFFLASITFCPSPVSCSLALPSPPFIIIRTLLGYGCFNIEERALRASPVFLVGEKKNIIILYIVL